MKNLAILGSTGSIGVSTLDVVRRFPGRFKVLGLSCGGNLELLAAQAHEFSPQAVSVRDAHSALALKARLGPTSVKIYHGAEGASEVASLSGVDMVVSAIVGSAGLVATMARDASLTETISHTYAMHVPSSTTNGEGTRFLSSPCSPLKYTAM